MLARSRNILAVVLALVLVAGVGAAVRHLLFSRLDAASRRVQVATELADSVRAQNAAVLIDGVRLRIEMEDARREAARAVLAAAAANSALAAQRARTTIAIAAAPDTCTPYIALLQTDVDSAVAVSQRYRSATDSLTRIDVLNSAEIARLTRSVSDAQQALARLSSSATVLVKASRKPFLTRLLPNLGFGATAGVSLATGRPDAVIGLTLSW